MDLLTIYADAWLDTAERVIRLCRQLSPADWSRPTDCPGWTVHDVVAHLAAIESELAGGPAPERVTNDRVVSAAYTRAGVDARVGRSPGQLVDELAAAVSARADSGWGTAPLGLPWDEETLLRNRAIDMWVHEQDIRRAVDRPGGWDAPGARVTVTAFGMAMPYVLGKLVAAPPGTTVVWELDGPVTMTITASVGDDGRAVAVDPPPPDVDAWLRMDSETFALLCAGRRDAASLDISVQGDAALGQRVLAAMTLTP